jgi:class 3 adenylate cyclase
VGVPKEKDTRDLHPARADDTSLAVILFEDIERSTALKRALTKRTAEQAFQDLRRKHDAIVQRIVDREGAGEIVKWTGDGFIALFRAPSVAVERAIEIQDAMHDLAQLKVRVGIDAGEVKVERRPDGSVDVFGAHVDWAAEQSAQIFLSTANRMVRLADGTQRSIRIPDAVLRIRPGRHEALLHALNAVANQWDSLFW